MKPITAIVTALLLAHPLLAIADGPTVGPNGGQLRDAGKYHMELVVKETALTVYVTDAKHAKVATKGATGSATVLAGKGTSRITLEPSGDSALAGSGNFQPAPDIKVVVSVTLPGQAPVQARFAPAEAAKPVDKAARK